MNEITETPILNNSFILGAEPSPALLISPGRRGRRSSTVEKKETPTEKPANEESGGKPQEKRPGTEKGMFVANVAVNEKKQTK